MYTQDIEKQINQACILAFGISLQELNKKKRSRTMSDKRHIVCHWLRQKTTLSNDEISKIIGRHRSLAIHAIKKVETLLQAKDPDIIATYKIFSDYIDKIDYSNLINYIVNLPAADRAFVLDGINKVIKHEKSK